MVRRYSFRPIAAPGRFAALHPSARDDCGIVNARNVRSWRRSGHLPRLRPGVRDAIDPDSDIPRHETIDFSLVAMLMPAKTAIQPDQVERDRFPSTLGR
jgi:hypothetical protein